MDIGLGYFDVPALCTRRSDLLDALISALPAKSVRLGRDFEFLDPQESGVRVHFSGGISAEHDFVIGADGIRSRVRSQVLGVHEPIFRGYTVWRGLARLTGAVPVRVQTVKPGDAASASAFSTRAATGSPGMRRRTPTPVMSTHPKAAGVNSCECSRAGTNRLSA